MRWVDLDLDRPRWRSTLSWRLHPRLQLGVEYNPAADEVGPLVTWFLLTEGDRKPALFFGTSSDRIGSPEGTQSYYLTAAKGHPRWPVSAYVSLNYSEWDEGFNFPFGAEVDLGSHASVRAMFDGDRPHLMLNFAGSRYGLSLLWVDFEHAGLSFSLGF